MRIFGIEVGLGRSKAQVGPTDLSPTFFSGWTPLLREGGAGFWQKGKQISNETAVSFHAVFSCITRIAGDISKIGAHLVEEDENGIKHRIRRASPFLPLLTRPNRFQNWNEFIEMWVLSLLMHGNTYLIKVRDNRNVVVALYILDPRRVQVLVSPGAAVFYRIQADNVTSVEAATTVPQSEIIHHKINTLYHPLVGVSPIHACYLSARAGLEIQQTSARFFENGAWPSGFLTAPGAISKDTAERLKESWQQNFGGQNRGKTAVLGDGLTYEQLTVNPVDAQLLEQLKYSAEMVCGVFHVPPFIVGIGSPPANGNAELLNQIYYSNCLQRLIEGIEWALGDGLSLPGNYEIQFCVEDLLRMDQKSQMETLKTGVSAALMTPNEGRKRLNLKPVPGGDAAYLQQQNYSLEALNRRDTQTTPKSTIDAPATGTAPTEPAAKDADLTDLVTAFRKGLQIA